MICNGGFTRHFKFFVLSMLVTAPLLCGEVAQAAIVDVSMVFPKNGDFVGDSLGFRAQTTNTALVTRLSFYRDASVYLGDGHRLTGSDFFEFAIDPRPLTEGSHSFYAVAYTDSASYSSPTVTVTVDHTAPSVTLLAPAPSATVGNGVILQAAASDAISGIKEVVFSRLDSGTRELGRATSPPFSLRTTAVSGPYSFRAVAFDRAGNSTQTDWIPVTVSGNNTWAKQFQSSSGGQVGPQEIVLSSSNEIILTGNFVKSASFGGTALSSAGQTDVFLAKLSRDGTHLWSVGVGSPGYDDGNSVAVDGNGNIVFGGKLASAISWLGSTHQGGFIAKYSSLGSPLWARSGSSPFGSVINNVESVATDSAGNVVTAGWFASAQVFDGQRRDSAGNSKDIWVTKHSASGSLLWYIQFGGTQDDRASAVSIDSTGNIFVTGEFRGTVSFGSDSFTAQGSDLFLLKLYPSGVPQWAKQLGGAGDDTGKKLRLDLSGNPILSGLLNDDHLYGGEGLLAKYTALGAPLFSLSLPCTMSEINLTAAGESRLAFAGTWSGCQVGNLLVRPTTGGGKSPFVGQLSSDGPLWWVQSYGGGVDMTTARAVAVRPDDGTVLISGNFGGFSNLTADFGGQQLTRVGDYDGYLYALPSDPTVFGPPTILSLPPNGYIDPLEDRDATTGVLFGVKDVSITFSAPVTATGGAALTPLNFPLSFTRNSAPATDLQTGQVPIISSVTAMSTVSYTLHLSSRIPLGAWTKITVINVVNAASGTAISPAANSIVLGFLPMDVTQDGRVLGEDINRWLAVKNGAFDPSPLTSLMLLDQKRNGVVAGEDITRAVQLLNGIGTFRAWSGFDMGAKP